MKSVLTEERDGVTWITLNKPERMNAYDAEMVSELTEAVDAASASDVIVITGTGKAFCAGGYLANLSDPDETELRRMFTASFKRRVLALSDEDFCKWNSVIVWFPAVRCL